MITIYTTKRAGALNEFSLNLEHIFIKIPCNILNRKQKSLEIVDDYHQDATHTGQLESLPWTRKMQSTYSNSNQFVVATSIQIRNYSKIKHTQLLYIYTQLNEAITQKQKHQCQIGKAIQ